MSQVFVRARVSEERLKELKQWALDNKTTLQGMLVNALDILLNTPVESTEKPREEVPEKLKTLIDGQRRLVRYMPEALLGDDEWKTAPWGEWAEMVIFSEIEGAAAGLGSNIEFFLGNLGAKQLIDRLERGAIDATDPDAPDYAAAAEACEKAAEQLRRYFAAKWKRASDQTETPET